MLDIDVPDDINDDELEDGLEYLLQIRCSISLSNPMSQLEIGDLNPRNLITFL